jgi:hypothetical protein
MFAWDGSSITEPALTDRFYDDYAWSDPPMSTGLDVQPPTSGGIWWTCQYQWEPPPGGCDALNAVDPQHADDCCYTFGPKTETNEHCNVFAYYWPRATVSTNGAESVFCN